MKEWISDFPYLFMRQEHSVDSAACHAHRTMRIQAYRNALSTRKVGCSSSDVHHPIGFFIARSITTWIITGAVSLSTFYQIYNLILNRHA